MKSESKYNYHYRPGYGSNNLLIEFISGVESKNFGEDLFDAIKEINPKILGQTDLWMNDEFIYEINSNNGHFMLSKDIWDMAFIMSEDNQPCISIIDQILIRDKRFEKIEVDYNKYKPNENASR